MKSRTFRDPDTDLKPASPKQDKAPAWSPQLKRNPWRVFAAFCIVAAGFCFVAAILAFSLRNTNPGGWDFIEYWAAEQQLIHGANPYDPAAILRIEQASGFDKARPEFWYSPPAALFMALPLGLLSAKTGLILWVIVLFACLSVSLRLLWRLNGSPDTLLFLLGYLFAPVLICLQAGQISIFFLLCLVLFLYFRESWPFAAGAVLLPCTLKPHLFLPFAIALLLWVVSRKAFRVLAGFLFSLVAGSALTFCFDPHIWSQYSQMMRTEGMLYEFVPTLSEMLRLLIDRNAVWLQFLPVGAGCIWAIWYFWTRRSKWDWMDHGLVVILVSGLCRPYGWFFDESILLPAVLTGVIRARESGRSLLPIGIVAGAALLEVIGSAKIASQAYLWTSPAWLGCYLYAIQASSKQTERAEVNEEGQVG